MTDSNNDSRLDEQDRSDAEPVGSIKPGHGNESREENVAAGEATDPASELEPVPLIPSAPLGLVGLHDIAAHLTAAGFTVVSDPDLKICAQRLQDAVRIWREEAGEHDLMPVLLLNTSRVAGLIPRIQRRVDLTVLGTAALPAVEGEGYRSYQLPGTVRDILKNAGVDGYEAVPDHLELQPDGQLLDADSGWDDWEPESAAQTAIHDETDESTDPVNLGDAVFGVTRSQQQPGRPVGRIGLGQVAITLSGSGGVGKSTFSLALAARAAERGQRVVLVDGNLGQGDLATFLRATGSGLPTMFDAVVAGRDLRAGIITPTRLVETRAAGLRKPGFGFLQAPAVEELRTGLVTPAAVYDLVEEARRISDLVVVDTQIVETDDPRRMVADLVLPQLGRGGWAIAVAGLSTAGLVNLNRLLTHLHDEDINTSRVFSMLARIPASADIDHNRLIQTLRERSVYLGTAYVDDTLQTALNRGDTLADQPALANLIDTLLNRMFDLPVIAPAHHPDQPGEPKRRIRPTPRAWSGWFHRKRSA